MNLSLGNVKILDFMDETLGTYGLPITALITTLFFTWFFKTEFHQSKANEVSDDWWSYKQQ